MMNATRVFLLGGRARRKLAGLEQRLRAQLKEGALRGERRMQEIMGKLPLLLQPKSDGQGREESAALKKTPQVSFFFVGTSPPSSHQELHAAVGASEDDTAGEESSSRSGVEVALARALEVPLLQVWVGRIPNPEFLRRFGGARVGDAAGALVKVSQQPEAPSFADFTWGGRGGRKRAG